MQHAVAASTAPATGHRTRTARPTGFKRHAAARRSLAVRATVEDKVREPLASERACCKANQVCIVK